MLKRILLTSVYEISGLAKIIAYGGNGGFRGYEVGRWRKDALTFVNTQIGYTTLNNNLRISIKKD